jgi:hypothetical protein
VDLIRPSYVLLLCIIQLEAARASLDVLARLLGWRVSRVDRSDRLGSVTVCAANQKGGRVQLRCVRFRGESPGRVRLALGSWARATVVCNCTVPGSGVLQLPPT